MLDQLKAMGALAALMKDKERLRRAGDQVRDALEASRVIGEAGGGAVRITMTGRMQVVSVEIGSAVAAGAAGGVENREMVEALIAEATNAAIVKAQSLMHEVVSKSARELGLPEIPGLGQLLGG